jgi:hypothetical protein
MAMAILSYISARLRVQRAPGPTIVDHREGGASKQRLTWCLRVSAASNTQLLSDNTAHRTWTWTEHRGIIIQPGQRWALPGAGQEQEHES